MAFLQQPIRTYALHFDHMRGIAQPTVYSRTRFIHVRFGADPGNLSLLIRVFVVDTAAATTGHITKLTNSTVRGGARMPAADFPAYYDLLRNQQPLSVRIDFATDPASCQTVPLDSYSLFSGPNPSAKARRLRQSELVKYQNIAIYDFCTRQYLRRKPGCLAAMAH